MLPIILISLIIVFLFLTLFLTYKYDKAKFKSIIGVAVTQAEDIFKSGEGAEKLTFVMNYIKPFLPWYLKMFINEKMLAKMIETVLSLYQPIFKVRG